MNDKAIRLDPAEFVEDNFPGLCASIQTTLGEVLNAIEGADFSGLERRSPALIGFDWGTYLRCSAIRVAHAAAALSERGVCQGRILDFGAYFGNFALLFAKAGFRVDAVDSYRMYGEALENNVRLLSSAGINIMDFADVGTDLGGIEPESYDAILCMGIIEHMPHTPRPLLESLNRVLKAGGHLIMDTPNLAYIYKRQKLIRGESIFPPISSQYYTEIPFEGHHREYTVEEMLWMLEQLGHEERTALTFNMSLYGLSCLEGQDLENYRIMENDPNCRELIMTISRKPQFKVN